MWAITFLDCSNIAYLPIFCFVIALQLYLFKKRNFVIKNLVNLKNRFLLVNYSPIRSLAKLFLSMFSILFLFFVLLNPAIKKAEQLVEQKCRDIFVVLDVSKSMLAQDIKPSRLEFAKGKIKHLLKLLPTDRFGLVLFASNSYVQCPLTRDHSAFNMFLDHIDKETVSGGATSLASAIQVCIDQCKRDTNQNKIIVIFTDGEDFSSDLLNVKKQAKDLDIKIFAMGIGTKEGASIPDYDMYGNLKGNLKDKSGKEVVSCLNEGIIENLAAEFSGTYVPLDKSNRDLKRIAKGIENFDKQKVEDKKLSAYDSIYPYFALASLICFAAGMLL